MRRTTKTILLTLTGITALATAGGALWWNSLDLASQPLANPATRPADLAFLQQARPANRGKILAVVTSTARSPDGSVDAGAELTELSRAYYVFKANGFEVEIASPKGGRPPVKIDEELVEADHAFLNDPEAQALLKQTKVLDEVDASDYAAVYVVGGKGVMFDLANNDATQRIAATIYERGGVVGAVCHGPVALLGAKLSNGKPLLGDKTVAGFSNEEELFLIPDAHNVFPFLLEDALRREAGRYTEGPIYIDHAITDGRLVTGQNPWSTWSVAEGMVRALGHQPVQRTPTSEENAIKVLSAFHAHGFAEADRLGELLKDVDKRLILLHAVIAVMEGRLGQAWSIQRLAH